MLKSLVALVVAVMILSETGHIPGVLQLAGLQ